MGDVLKLGPHDSLDGEVLEPATGAEIDILRGPAPCSRSTPMSSGSPADTPGPVAGLCDGCRHQRLVPNSRGSVFSLCERSREDASYPRYPRLPVLSCPGFEPARAQSESEPPR